MIAERVPPGTHRISVEAKGFAGREQLIEVRAGELDSLEWMLLPAGRASPASPAQDRRVPVENYDPFHWPPK